MKETTKVGSRRIQAFEGAVPWKPSVDPRPVKATKTLKQPVPISRDKVVDYRVSGQNVVTLESDRPEAKSFRDRIFRFDNRTLEGGSRLTSLRIPSAETQARIDIVPGSILHCVSRSGRLALTQRGKTSVLDIWSMEEGKRLVSFRYDDRDGSHLSFAQFIGNDNLMIAHGEKVDDDVFMGVVCLWKIPECQQVYAIEMPKREIETFHAKDELQVMPRPMTLSPGGKYMAVDMGDRVRLFNVESGEIQGDLQFARKRNPQYVVHPLQGSFHPDGNRLVVAIPSNGQTDFIVWELESGQLIFDEPLSITQFSPRTLLWHGDNYVLLSDTWGSNWRMVDLGRHCIVWNFTSTKRIDRIDASGVYLGTEEISQGRDLRRTVLKSDSLPIRDAIAEIERLMPTSPPPVLQAGDVVRLDVALSPDMPPSLIQKVKTSFQDALGRNGITVSDRAPVRLRASMTQIGSEHLNYSVTTMFGSRDPFRGRTFSFTEGDFECRIEVIDAQGIPRWHRTGTAYKTLPWWINVRNLNVTQAVNTEARDSLARSVERFFVGANLPRKIYPQPMSGTEKKGRYPGLGSTPLGPAYRYDPNRRDRDNATFVKAALADERSFIANTREYFNQFYADLLSDDEATWRARMKWSPLLKRAAPAMKWGFAVQFSRDAPAGSFIRIQQVNSETVKLLDQPTAGAGPKLIEAVRRIGEQNGFGDLPAFRDNRVREPALLGTGNSREILEAAQKAKLDFVVVAFFNKQIRGSGKRKRQTTELAFRILDATTGERVHESGRLKDSDLANTAEDLGGELAQSTAVFVSEQLSLQPVPELKADDVRERIRFLLENPSINPMAELLELKFYVTIGATTEATAIRAAQALLTDDQAARTIIEGNQSERATAVKKLLEDWNPKATSSRGE